MFSSMGKAQFIVSLHYQSAAEGMRIGDLEDELNKVDTQPPIFSTPSEPLQPRPTQPPQTAPSAPEPAPEPPSQASSEPNEVNPSSSADKPSSADDKVA